MHEAHRLSCPDSSVHVPLPQALTKFYNIRIYNCNTQPNTQNKMNKKQVNSHKVFYWCGFVLVGWSPTNLCMGLYATVFTWRSDNSCRIASSFLLHVCFWVWTQVIKLVQLLYSLSHLAIHPIILELLVLKASHMLSCLCVVGNLLWMSFTGEWLSFHNDLAFR